MLSTPNEVKADYAGLSVIAIDDELPTHQSLVLNVTHPHATSQQFLVSQLIKHESDAGINPLVDAAASLFSTMGKIKHIPAGVDLLELHHELVQEVELFQQTLKSQQYDSDNVLEFIPVTTYVLCATLDSIISEAPWASNWKQHQLLATFMPEPPSQRGFFIILEKLIRYPDIYIDVMEFIYLCLSFGFKFQNETNEVNREQLEQITNSLYKRIRAYRGGVSKVLSPFPLKAIPPQAPVSNSKKSSSIWNGVTILLSGLLMSALILLLYFW